MILVNRSIFCENVCFEKLSHALYADCRTYTCVLVRSISSCRHEKNRATARSSELKVFCLLFLSCGNGVLMILIKDRG